MMKLLLMVLALSSVTHQRSETRQKKQKYVDLVDVSLKQKRQIEGSSSLSDNGRLEWQSWTGSLPNGAVSIYNAHTGRVDYVCKHGCYSGFYTPKMGSNCYYAYGYKELHVSHFEILVNKDNFVILDWKAGSDGSVPENSVRTCTSDTIYVGKNEYGLGEVIPRQKLFFLPWKGVQYSYRSYETLTIKTDIQSELIDKVTYDKQNINIVKSQPETLLVSSVTNNECRPASKVVRLSKKFKVEHKWDIGSSPLAGIKTSFSGGIPHVVNSKVEVSAEKSFELSKTNTMTEEVSNSFFVALEVPPSSRCKVRLLGQQFKVKIPFTAQLTRTYRDQRYTRTSLSGTYKSIQVGNLHAKFDKCKYVSYNC